MANTLTNLAPDLYKAADIVARELVGCIPSSTINAGSERVAEGQTIRAHFTRTATAVNVVPSMTIPEGTDQTIDNKTLQMNTPRAIQIPWTGEEQLFIDSGPGYRTVLGDQIVQAMRTLVNEAENDLWSEIYTNASRSFGTPGTTPFASNFNEVAEIYRILIDNGMPPSDGQASLVINTAASTNLRQLAQLQGVNTSGNEEMLRRGTLLDLQGLMLKESAQVGLHTKGTGTGYLTNSASLAVGDTVIPVDTGSGTIVPGDVISFAGDTNNSYVVESYSAPNITIQEPGLRVAVPDNNAITIANNRTANVAFHRAAVEIAFRPVALPEGGDAATDRITVSDPISGLTFDVATYKGYKKAMIEVSSIWAVKAWKGAFIADLAG